jgi:hypothetical protein
MIVLTHLKRHPRGSESQLLQYLLSEVFDIFEPKDTEAYRSPHPGSLRHESLWKMLYQVYETIKEEFEKNAADSDMDRSRNSVTSSNLDHASLFRHPAKPGALPSSQSSVITTTNGAKTSSDHRTRSEDLTHNHYDHRRQTLGNHPGTCTTGYCVTDHASPIECKPRALSQPETRWEFLQYEEDTDRSLDALLDLRD